MRDMSDYGKAILEVDRSKISPLGVMIRVFFMAVFPVWGLFVYAVSLISILGLGLYFLLGCFISFIVLAQDRKSPCLVVYEKGFWARCFLHYKGPLFVSWEDVDSVSLRESGGPFYKAYWLLLNPYDPKKFWKKASFLKRICSFFDVKMFLSPLPVLVTNNLEINPDLLLKRVKEAMEGYKA